MPEQDSTLFKEVYEIAVNSFGNPYISGEAEKLEGANRVIGLIKQAKHDGNRVLDAAGQNITMFESADIIRRNAIGGIKKYLPGIPRRSNSEEISDLEKLVPGASHYEMANPFKLDNPVTGGAYGLLAAAAFSLNGVNGDIDSAAKGLELLQDNLILLGFGGGLGTLSGLVGMLLMRNKFGDSEDPSRARIWDSTQFLDAIYYFAKQGPEKLANLRGQEYPAPLYAALPTGKFVANRNKAVANLMDNPFLERMGLLVTD